MQPTLKYATVERVRQSRVVDLSESSQYGRKPKTSRRRPFEPIGAAATTPSSATSPPDPEVEAGSTVAPAADGRSTVSSSPLSGPASPAGPAASPLREAPAAQTDPWPASRIWRPVAWPAWHRPRGLAIDLPPVAGAGLERDRDPLARLERDDVQGVLLGMQPVDRRPRSAVTPPFSPAPPPTLFPPVSGAECRRRCGAPRERDEPRATRSRLSE